MKLGKPIKEPENPNICNPPNPATPAPIAAPIEDMIKTRTYFKLIPYIAGSVTPQKAEIAAGAESPLRSAFLDLKKTVKAPTP